MNDLLEDLIRLTFSRGILTVPKSAKKDVLKNVPRDIRLKCYREDDDPAIWYEGRNGKLEVIKNIDIKENWTSEWENPEVTGHHANFMKKIVRDIELLEQQVREMELRSLRF